ncbi:MAG TPA: hypothetical protein VII28_00150, partial [Puia sp.]
DLVTDQEPRLWRGKLRKATKGDEFKIEPASSAGNVHSSRAGYFPIQKVMLAGSRGIARD